MVESTPHCKQRTAVSTDQRTDNLSVPHPHPPFTKWEKSSTCIIKVQTLGVCNTCPVEKAVYNNGDDNGDDENDDDDDEEEGDEEGDNDNEEVVEEFGNAWWR